MSADRVVDLRSRTGYAPNLGALACGQVAAARERLGLSTEEFANILGPLLRWTDYEVTPELVESWEKTTTPPGDVLVAAGLAAQNAPHRGEMITADPVNQLIGDRFADVSAVYATRTEFTAAMPPTELFRTARQIDAAGISLNLLCQYPDKLLRASIEEGTVLRGLFLDPSGDEVQRYEREEGHLAGHISTLTEVNIQALLRIQSQLSTEAQERVQIATYNDVPHFNLMLLDKAICVMQPYLSRTRGVDSPTFVINRRSSVQGLYPTFEQVFDVLWQEGKRL
jgi:hypothetical protein